MNALVSHRLARRCQLGAVALAVATFASQSQAQSQALTATDNLAVSASVVASCTITASLPVAFGNYDPINANANDALDAVGAVTTTCTSGSEAVVTLGQGANAGGGSDSSPVRRMVSTTGQFLEYALYSDSARQVTWGNSAPTGLSITGNGGANSASVYGRVAAGQNVRVGAFTDSVVATVTF
ncbi:fimbrial major subunit CsuA/B family protein [Xylophilus sp. Kf1]|nr:fimbrial major subunit CsuA/B family protein [Xylophilus sp. Kf1]